MLVELGKHVAEEEQRLLASALAQQRRFGDSQRERRRALLSARCERCDRLAGKCHLHVIAMGAGQCEARADVTWLVAPSRSHSAAATLAGWIQRAAGDHRSAGGKRPELLAFALKTRVAPRSPAATRSHAEARPMRIAAPSSAICRPITELVAVRASFACAEQRSAAYHFDSATAPSVFWSTCASITSDNCGVRRRAFTISCLRRESTA